RHCRSSQIDARAVPGDRNPLPRHRWVPRLATHASPLVGPSVADLKFLRGCSKLAWERQIQKPHSTHKFTSVPLIPKFAQEGGARSCELRNRDTSVVDLKFLRGCSKFA